jgi:hypothetical protein
MNFLGVAKASSFGMQNTFGYRLVVFENVRPPHGRRIHSCQIALNGLKEEKREPRQFRRYASRAAALVRAVFRLTRLVPKNECGDDKIEAGIAVLSVFTIIKTLNRLLSISSRHSGRCRRAGSFYGNHGPWRARLRRGLSAFAVRVVPSFLMRVMTFSIVSTSAACVSLPPS